MNDSTGHPQPQKVLTPRRKRTFLSFRRKSDLIWFIVSLSMFSGGLTALIVFTVTLARGRQGAPAAVVASTPLSTGRSPLPEPALVGPAAPSTPRPVPGKPERSVRPVASVPVRKAFPLPLEQKPRESPSAPLSKPVPIPTTRHEGKAFLLIQQADSFKTAVGGAAIITVTPTAVLDDPAVQMTYDLSRGDWAQFYLDVQENFSTFSRVQFLFNGAGANNTLELRLVDADGTCMGTSWSRQTGRKEWTVVNLPLADLTYLWGGDSFLDLKRVRRIIFVVSKKRGDKGGRGRVTIRGIKFS